jgi:glycosyltransferase involved in cell wall biosynthesis
MIRGISVVICCYNSTSRLQPTLKHIANQKVSKDIPWEIIIVDNNSDDGTSEYAKKLWQELNSNIPFQVIFEYQQGLSFARKKGINTALYEYILFCDDDNWLSNNYVEYAFHLMKSKPKIGALGGQCRFVSSTILPYWFPTYQGDYAVGVQDIMSGDVTFRQFVWGAGMVIRKSVLLTFQELNIESQLTGRNGDEILSGDDSEMCYWIIWAGYRLWYDENLILDHFMPQNRLTKTYYEKLKNGHNKAQSVLYIYDFITRHSPNRFWKHFLVLKYFQLKAVLLPNNLSLKIIKKIIQNYNDITKRFAESYK